MKAAIVAIPKFYMTLTAEEIEALVTCSSHHYDRTCNMASRLGGFIYGWHNTLTTPTDTEPLSTAAVSATTHQLDLCCKILEMSVQVCGSNSNLVAIKLRGELMGLLNAGHFFVKDLHTLYN
jgi:hypothetical protein